MKQWIEKSNLPLHEVTTCAIGAQYIEIIKALTSLGIQVIPIKPDIRLPKPLQGHGDMQICYLGQGKMLLLPGREELREAFTGLGFLTEDSDPPGKYYPQDVKLNAVFLGKKCICNSKTIDKKITNHCREQGIEIVEVSQGYSKCNLCVVDERSGITSDKGIERVLSKLGLDILLISEGHIQLPGYPWGFIGGCSGLLGKDTIAFTGSLNSHPDAEKIKNFIHRRRMNIIELTNGPLLDIGSILPLEEKVERTT